MGGWGGILSMALGAFKEGGYSDSPVGFAAAPMAAFNSAPHYAQGTANTSGIPAILHDNEAVIPLTRGRKVPVDLGDAVAGDGRTMQHIQIVQNISTPNADSFRKSQKQVASEMGVATQRAMKANG